MAVVASAANVTEVILRIGYPAAEFSMHADIMHT
jgi:hypothetical protein